jgi:oligosaccharyltransferase complex subunit gamma
MGQIKLCLLVLACLVAWQVSAAVSEKKSELIQKAKHTKDAIIQFKTSDFDHYAAGAGRDYHLVFFLNAAYLAGNTQMNLPALRQNFALMAKAFKQGSNADDIFFAELSYEGSKELYKRLNVKSLPFIFSWGPESVAKEGRSIKINKASQCGPRISTYPWPAEDLVTCVSRQTGFSAGAIERPTVVQNPLFPLGLLAFIVLGGAVAWKLYNSPIVRITGLWTLGALGVYWFATSGGMYNIIRGIPFSIVRDGKKVYWMDGRQGQLGAEGFIMGSSYIFFSSTLASLTYVVPRIKNTQARGLISLVLVLVAALSAFRILETYHAKSGMRMRNFFHW